MLILAVFLLAESTTVFANSPPDITYVFARQRVITRDVYVNYNVTDLDGDPLFISMELLDSLGNVVCQCQSVSGDIGPNIQPGNDKRITWYAGVEFSGEDGDDYTLRIYASDNVVPSGFVQIPPPEIAMPATFTMGSLVESDETPRLVTLTGRFYMASTEVTNAQYVSALQWAYNEGYVTVTTSSVLDNLDGSTIELLDLDASSCQISFINGVFSTPDPDRPVVEVSWYGSVSYCDWLSLQEGLPRTYDHSTWSCNSGNPYTASGYRLPTEAEWEFACRAGTTTYFNTGDCLDSETEANYKGSFPYTGCPSGPYLRHTSDVGSYLANLWGLLDIHGNVLEWCNDWYGYYNGDETDPGGAESGSYRVRRGGHFNHIGRDCGSACRGGWSSPSDSRYDIGFRPVRSTQ